MTTTTIYSFTYDELVAAFNKWDDEFIANPDEFTAAIVKDDGTVCADYFLHLAGKV